MPDRVILAYANDISDSLKFLEHENETVYRYLNRMDESLVIPVRRPEVTIENLFAEFWGQGRGNYDIPFFGSCRPVSVLV
jgi:hypothetical protein